jgi:hypothetical protein
MVPTNDDTWLIDSGASRHMIGFRNHLTNLVEKETNLHVVLGDDARYNVKGVGTSTFQLDSDMQLQLSEVCTWDEEEPCLHFFLRRLRLQGYLLGRKSSCVAQRLTYKFYQSNWCSRKQLIQIDH